MRDVRASALRLLAWALVVGLLAVVSAPPTRALAAGTRTLDSSCKASRTEVLPVLAYPRKGEPVEEHKEITLQLLSLVPCSAPSKRGIPAIEALIQEGVAKGLGVQDVVARLEAHFRSPGNAARDARIVFALVSEFYDNLSLTLFELSPGREPVSLKLTMKRETWTDALEELRPRFEDTNASFLSAFDKTEARRSVRIVFESEGATGAVSDATLHRLRSELAASLSSRFRNPLPPKLWERRAFFRLADDKEAADATLIVRVHLVGTRVYAQVTAKETDANARSFWLEGSLASLLVFENQLFENSRDMLMELVSIYDYSITLGPEFLLDGKKPSILPSLSMRHNRGDLAATFRIRAGRMHWSDTCGVRPLLVDFGLLPGWQFFQSERVSVDMGIELAAGFIDIAFTKNERCEGKPIVETYISAGYGAFVQANLTTIERFSLLGRVAAGGVSVFATGDKSDEEVRSTRNLSLFLGVGVAL